jgi:hypothetical protein
LKQRLGLYKNPWDSVRDGMKFDPTGLISRKADISYAYPGSSEYRHTCSTDENASDGDSRALPIVTFDVNHA